MLETVSNFIFEHIPAIATWLFFTYLTVVLDTRVFDKATIDELGDHKALHWIRKFLPILIIVLSGSIGFFWNDPESLGYDRNASVAYFAIAGALAEPSWAILSAIAKKRGFKVWLPGGSLPPPPIEKKPPDNKDAKQ
jgi:hypothetical protein